MRPLQILPLLTLIFASVAQAQRPAPTQEPTTPPARVFRDARSGIAFQVPAGWDLNRKDREVSTFALDAPTIGKTAQLRAVADIAFNPLPQTNFSGAYFYASVTPKLSDADCARQAYGSGKQEERKHASAEVAGISFAHGHDEHGGVCVESRDEIYTTLHKGACYRFDLVINNFCGGDVSGVREMSEPQLESVRKRLEGILNSVQLDK